jgi:hypothetical protein
VAAKVMNSYYTEAGATQWTQSDSALTESPPRSRSETRLREAPSAMARWGEYRFQYRLVGNSARCKHNHHHHHHTHHLSPRPCRILTDADALAAGRWADRPHFRRLQRANSRHWWPMKTALTLVLTSEERPTMHPLDRALHVKPIALKMCLHSLAQTCPSRTVLEGCSKTRSCHISAHCAVQVCRIFDDMKQSFCLCEFIIVSQL